MIAEPQLSTEQREIVGMVRTFVEKEIMPVQHDLEHDDVYPEDIVKQMKELGLFGLAIPEEFGGGGVNFKTYALCIEEICRGWMSIAGVINTHFITAYMIGEFGTDEQKQRFLKPLWTGEEVWCQLFSEPGAGSDLAAVSTRAVRDGDSWVVNGQKVWTSAAHKARFAILLVRTDPNVSKHAGLSYFVCDMTDPGVDVRPLRQLTGEAEFNEVFLTDVRIPDFYRLGEEGQGWKVATATLMNERVAIGGAAAPREGGMIGVVAKTWRDRPELRTAELHDRLMMLWVEAEVARLTGQRLRQKLALGQPGPEGSTMKLTFARLAQQLSGLEVELLGEDGLRYSDWTMVRPDIVEFTGRDAGYRYLRAKGNSIEGGTSEILRNIVAERVLGLPAEPRTDKDIAWKDLPK